MARVTLRGRVRARVTWPARHCLTAVRNSVSEEGFHPAGKGLGLRLRLGLG